LGLAKLEDIRGNQKEALNLADDAYRIAVATGNVWGEINAIATQAMCCQTLGEFKHGLWLVRKGKDLVVQASMQGGELDFTFMNLEAEGHYLKIEYAEARRIHEQILHQTSPVLCPSDYAHALVSIVCLDIVTGIHTDIVSDNLQAAMSTFQNVQYPRGISLCKVHYTDMKASQGDTAAACAEYACAFASAYSKDTELTCYCLARLADSTHPVQAVSEVARWAVIFLAFALRPVARSTLTVHQALRCLGDVLAQQGMDEDAHSILTIALEGFTWMDVHRSRAECMRTLGDVYFRRGELAKAATLWTEARPLFKQSLQAKAVAEIDSRLAKLEAKPDVPITPSHQSISFEPEPVHDDEDKS
jgi:hypothetical protein